MDKKEFYTAEDLADKIGVNIMTIYRYIKAGKLKAFKFGKELVEINYNLVHVTTGKTV